MITLLVLLGLVTLTVWIAVLVFAAWLSWRTANAGEIDALKRQNVDLTVALAEARRQLEIAEDEAKVKFLNAALLDDVQRRLGRMRWGS